MRSENFRYGHAAWQPLAGKLLLFTLPIALSSMVQQLFNAADTADRGPFWQRGCACRSRNRTRRSLRLIVTVSSGLSIGANVLLAKHIGRKAKRKSCPLLCRPRCALGHAASAYVGLSSGAGDCRGALAAADPDTGGNL